MCHLFLIEMLFNATNNFNIILHIFAQYHGNLQTLPNSDPGKVVEANLKTVDVDHQLYGYDHKLEKMILVFYFYNIVLDIL